MTLMLLAASDAVLDEILDDPAGLEPLLASGDTNFLGLDKSWHILHFLLNGAAWTGTEPLDFLIQGGEVIDDFEVGFAAPRVFLAHETAAICRALAPIDRAALLARWDCAAIRAADILAVDPDAVAQEQAYAGDHYDALQSFLRRITGAGLGMIVC